MHRCFRDRCSRQRGSIVVNEGQTANNTGTYDDPDGNATVTLSASSGTVTRDPAGSGTWSWSFPTTDGPDQNRTVTITASDGTESATTTFSLTFNNVAPTVAQPNNFNNTLEFGYVYAYDFSVSDPGNDSWSIQPPVVVTMASRRTLTMPLPGGV